MVRGFYSAAAGVFGQQKSFNTIANNISNASTSGFKSQGTIESSFGDHLVARMSSDANMNEKNIGNGSFMTVNSTTYTDFSQGVLEETGRSVDLAIEGEGFFLIRTKTEGDVLSRNGQFEIDSDGELALLGVGKVLDGSKNPIGLKSIDFTVDKQGNLKEGETAAGTLFIAAQGDQEKLVSTGKGSYKSEADYVQATSGTFSIEQGALEKSNMNISQEMSKIIAGQNRYNSCSQILKIYDRINEMTVNQIGRIG